MFRDADIWEDLDIDACTSYVLDVDVDVDVNNDVAAGCFVCSVVRRGSSSSYIVYSFLKCMEDM